MNIGPVAWRDVPIVITLLTSANLFIPSAAPAGHERYNWDGIQLAFNADLVVVGFLNKNS